MTHPHVLIMTVHGAIRIDHGLNVMVDFREDGIYLLPHPADTAIPAPAPEPVPTPTWPVGTAIRPAQGTDGSHHGMTSSWSIPDDVR